MSRSVPALGDAVPRRKAASRPIAAEPGAGGSDNGAIVFPQGLPGFPGATRFALRPLTGASDGLLLLQSVEDPELRFLVLPYADRPDGQVPLSRLDVDGACEALGIRPEHAAVLLVVTSWREPGCDGAEERRLYVNLRAPVVLDTVRRTAIQHVLPSPAYPVRHFLGAAA
jgi:flagellar assembly factor FliW